MIIKLEKPQFEKYISSLSFIKKEDYGFLYELYDTSVEGIIELGDTNPLFSVNGINNAELINYCIGEYLYGFLSLNEERKKLIENSEDNISMIASVIVDKYLSLSMFNFEQNKVMNKYMPPVSSLNQYLNFIQNILNNFSRNDPEIKLVRDLLVKSVSIARCVLSLLTDGYVTEAYASWRTLHECECTLTLLEKYGNSLISLYLKHMQYGMAYKGVISNKEEQDKIFVQIKSEMAEHNLKSKDMKKYIEYGWLYGVKEFNELENGKLNFKDGLEAASGLGEYGDSYTLSSEIVHATPMLIYPNNDYFYYKTLLSLYESFFRLEKSFVTFLFDKVGDEAKASYSQMRQLYYAQLLNIYQREKNNFISKNKK